MTMPTDRIPLSEQIDAVQECYNDAVDAFDENPCIATRHKVLALLAAMYRLQRDAESGAPEIERRPSLLVRGHVIVRPCPACGSTRFVGRDGDLVRCERCDAPMEVVPAVDEPAKTRDAGGEA